MGFKPSIRDHVFMSGLYFGIVSAVLVFVLPLRVSPSDDLAVFPKRVMTMHGLTGRDEESQSWSHWADLTCKNYKVAAQDVFRADTAHMEEAIAEERLDGISQPCSSLHGCRDHTAVRCYWYGAMASEQMWTMVYHGVGLVFYIAAIGGLVAQVNLRIAVMMALFGCAIQLLANLHWALVSDGLQNAIRTQSFWPYADLTHGFMAACGVNVLQILVACSGVTLSKHTGKGIGKGEESEPLKSDTL